LHLVLTFLGLIACGAVLVYLGRLAMKAVAEVEQTDSAVAGS
jgi:hypothetical protein